MLMSFGHPCTTPRTQEERELEQFACHACGSPAITLPVEFHDRAPVHCQGCGVLIATWAVFKRRTTRAILAETEGTMTNRVIVAPDPLDASLVQAHRSSL